MLQHILELAVSHHVGLPPFDVDAAVDAPPEVVFGLSLPGEDGEPWHREGDGAKPRALGAPRPGSPHHCALACNLIVCQHLPSRRSFRDTLKTHTQGSREDSALPFLISSSAPRKSSVHHMRGQHRLKNNIYLQNQAFAASQMTCLPVRHIIHKLNQMYFDS